ncbi:hypothetical protein ACWCQN_45995 [Streptomyces sp. NPDC001984]
MQPETAAAVGAAGRDGVFALGVFGFAAGVRTGTDGLSERAGRSLSGDADDEAAACPPVGAGVVGTCGSAAGKPPLPLQAVMAIARSPTAARWLPRIVMVRKLSASAAFTGAPQQDTMIHSFVVHSRAVRPVGMRREEAAEPAATLVGT